MLGDVALVIFRKETPFTNQETLAWVVSPEAVHSHSNVSLVVALLPLFTEGELVNDSAET